MFYDLGSGLDFFAYWYSGLKTVMGDVLMSLCWHLTPVIDKCEGPTMEINELIPTSETVGSFNMRYTTMSVVFY